MANDTKIVFSKELANKLVNRGFNILRTEINIKDPKYKVFVFEYSPELEEAVKEYKQSKGG